MNRALGPLAPVVVFSLLPATQGSAEMILVAWSHGLRAADADGHDTDRISYVSETLPFAGALLV